MSWIGELDHFKLDYVFIKFAGLRLPTPIPWLELADGVFVPEESTDDEIVILTRKKNAKKDEGVVTPETADDTPTKTHLKKTALIEYFNAKLREPGNTDVVDYGPVEDFRIQPGGRDLTKGVFHFLIKYGAT